MQWGALVSWNSQGKEEKGGKFSSIFYWEYWTNWCKNYLKFLKFYLFLKFFALIINLKSKKENILLGLNLFIYLFIFNNARVSLKISFKGGYK